MIPVLLKPSIYVEVVVLLAPQHSRQRLAVHPPFIFVQRGRRNPIVELVSIVVPDGRQTEADSLASAGGHVEDIVGRRLGPDLGGVDRLAAARDGVLVE